MSSLDEKIGTFNVPGKVPYKEDEWKGEGIKVSFSKPIMEDDMHIGGHTFNWRYAPKFKVNFKCQLPKHVFDKINGKEVPVLFGSDRDKIRNYGGDMFGKKFTKTLSSPTLEGLLKEFNKCTRDYNSMLKLERLCKDKKIFIKYEGQHNAKITSYQDSTDRGSKTEIQFGLMIGYGGKDGDTNYYYNSDFTYIRDKDFEKEHTIVEWSQEREDFLRSMEAQFVKLNENLTKFTNEMSDDSIEGLMLGGLKKLLA